MTKFELSKFDFDAINVAFELTLGSIHAKNNKEIASRIERLKDKFAKAHTAWLETEEE